MKRLRSASCFLVLFFLLPPLKGQEHLWDAIYGGSDEDRPERADAMIPYKGGYVMVGYTSSNDYDVGSNNGGYDVWVLHVDSAGSIRWAENYGGFDGDGGEAVKKTKDGGLIVAGESSSSDQDVSQNNGNLDAWVFKLDSSGTLKWEESFGSSFNDEARSIALTEDGGYLVAGYCGKGDGDVSTHYGKDDYWVVKLDSSGNMKWEKNYGGSERDVATCIISTDGGGAILGGITKSYDHDISIYYGARDQWILKLDSAGNIEWERSYGGSDPDILTSITHAKGGGYILAGSSKSNDVDVTFNNGGWDLWVHKIDTTGSLEWEKNYGGSGRDRSKSVVQHKNGHIGIVGRSESDSIDLSGNYGDDDLWVLETDENGNILWEENYGGSSRDVGRNIIKSHRNGYLISGYSSSSDVDKTTTIGNSGYSDYWVLSLCPPSDTTLIRNTCSTYTVPSGDTTLTASGTYIDTLTNDRGCDSLIHIQLSVDTSSAFLSPSSCSSYTVPSGDTTLSSSGTYIDTLTNSAGCDSLITIDLSIDTSMVSVKKSSCYNYTVPSGDTTLTSSGSYMDTLTNSKGCDSVLNIDLTILDSSSATLTRTACNSYTLPSGDSTYTSSGTYKDTLVNSVGCDSLMTIDLTVLDSSSSFIKDSACYSYTVPSGDTTYNSSGIYTDTLVNSVGCDSLITIDLSIDTSSATISASTCSSYTVPSGDTTYTTSGVYSDTLTNAQGCDSLLTIDLTREYLDTTIQVQEDTLIGAPSNDSLQWVDCSGDSSIDGESELAFYPMENGTYRVEVLDSGCVDTSHCMTSLPSSDWNAHSLKLPKPLKGVHFADSSLGWVVAGSGGIYRTQNGGDDWTLQHKDSIALYHLDLIDQANGWCVGANGRVLRTANGGNSWFPQASGINDILHAVHFQNHQEGWTVGSNGTILHTDDGGSNWNEQNTPTSKDLRDLVFLDSDTGFAIGEGGAVLRTTNGGTNWNFSNSGVLVDLSGIDLLPNGTLVLVGNDGVILLSNDLGLSWSGQLSGSSEDLKTVHFRNAKEGWIGGTNGTLLHSKNGGSDWSSSANGTFHDINDLHISDTIHGWAVGENSTFLRSSLEKSVDSNSSLNGHSTGSRIRIYPNPASERTIISIEQERIHQLRLTLVDLLGKKIQKRYLKGDGPWELSLEEIEKGVYFLKFEGEVKGEWVRWTEKLVVK